MKGVEAGFSLADAIRKGAAQHPQCLGTFFQRHPLDGITATCVIGAALVGRFGPATSTEDFAALIVAYPELTLGGWRACPVAPTCPRFHTTGPDYTKALYLTLAHLHDVHQWTREQCADWLEAR